MLDFESSESHVLLNPRMPAEERRTLESYVVPLPGHVWLATSGTTGALKLTALSKRALLASAAAVNRHLESTANDVWLCVLPTFHVGGLGIYARAHLTNSRIIEAPWSPAQLSVPSVTFVSLVPTQVIDLVKASILPPKTLRAAIVGGGPLPTPIYNQAKALGWPLLPSYGMTECCSQAATAKPASPDLILLDHLQARIADDGRLALKGESLLTGYADSTGFRDPKRDGWFLTEDLAELDGRILRVYGRAGEFIKIGGESVDLARLDAILGALAGPHAAVFAVPDERLGHVIHLAVDASADADTVAAAFAERVHPFERPRRIHRVPEIPRTPLGKLIRKRLLEGLE